MLKADIRKLYKQQRIKLSSKDILIKDDLILLQFQKMFFNHHITLLSYWPLENFNEPNTHLFTNYLRHTIANLRICYPVTNFVANNLQAVLIDETTIYSTNAYQITEPKNGIEIAATEIDVIFVPMLQCDKQGYRVGYGKGFYDKFLAKCNAHTIKIGFNYFEPIEQIFDINEYDIPLDYCITPENIYEF